jgi:putative oxidoreductase
MAISLGLLILRIVAGLTLAAHGSQKLFGWFGGPGFNGTLGMMKSMRFEPNWLWALLAGLGEFAGGLLLAVGFLTPIGAIGVVGAMLMAILKAHWKNGFWNSKRGYEFPLNLLVIALVIGIVGPGNYAIDAAIGFTLPIWLFIIGLILAIIVDIVGLVISRQQVLQQSAA